MVVESAGASSDGTDVSYALLKCTRPWRSIAGCPGRCVLRAPDPELDRWMEQHGQLLPEANCEDPVFLWRLPGGGAMLSYRKADGRWVHTLNDDTGWLRKGASLGVSLGE